MRTFCSSTGKTSTVIPIFYFTILIGTMLPFNEKKNGINLCSVFSAILLNCTDLAITGRIARVPNKSTLRCKVKPRALKGVLRYLSR